MDALAGEVILGRAEGWRYPSTGPAPRHAEEFRRLTEGSKKTTFKGYLAVMTTLESHFHLLKPVAVS